MATSGSTNFSQTRNDIIEAALSQIGALGLEETASSSMLSHANKALNRLVKHMENDMLHLWKRSEATLFLQQDQAEYTLGGTTTDHCTQDFTTTTVIKDRIAGQTKLHVDSLDDILVGDYIGIVEDHGAIEWTTVSSLNNSGTKIYKIDLGSALTVVVSAGATITNSTAGNTGTLLEAEAAGATVLYVTTSNTWTTSQVLSIPGNSSNSISDIGFNTITLTDALTNASSEDKNVYAYTTKISKPLEIFGARRRTVSTAYDLPMTELAYKDYMNMPTKETSGVSGLQYATNRLIDSTKVFVWQQPDNVDYVMKITYAPALEDFDTATNTPDFPQEWYHYLVLDLAVALAPAYGLLNNQAFAQIKLLRDEAKLAVMSFDNEQTYLKIEMDSGN